MLNDKIPEISQPKKDCTERNVVAWLFYLIESLQEDQQINLFKTLFKGKIGKILSKAVIDMTKEQRFTLLKMLEDVVSQNGEIERRQNPRKDCMIYVNLSANGFSGNSYILDINQNGAFIETDDPYSIGQITKLSFPVPDSGKHMNIIARVMRTEKQGIGVRFNKLSNQQFNSIGSFSENKERVYEIKS
jgi:Tfp pilus assembly protein PilZ